MEGSDSSFSGPPNKKQKVIIRPASAVPRTARACQACHVSKVRCDGVGGERCSRCVRIGVDCLWAPSQRGKSKAKLEENNTASQSPEYGASPKSGTNPPPPTSYASRLPPSVTAPVDSTRNSKLLTVSSTAAHVRRLSTLPLPGDSSNPLHTLAEAGRALLEEDAGDHGEGNGGGVNEPGPPGVDARQWAARYFQPNVNETPALTEESARRPKGEVEAPHSLRFISEDDAELLFQIYREKLHPHLPCLALASVTRSYIARRSNFLFNAICCVTSRFCTEKPELRLKLERFGRLEMSRFPLDKCLEVVQAHLIYAQWNLMSADRFETDSTWLRIGIAVRTALDLNLHRIASSPNHGLPSPLRDSIIRTWLLAYALDQTLSAQQGKPSSSVGDIFAQQNLKIAGSSLDDARVVTLVNYSQLLTNVLASIGPGSSGDLYPTSTRDGWPDIRATYDGQFQKWAEKSLANLNSLTDQAEEVTFNRGQILIYAHYAKLVVNSGLLQTKLDAKADDLAVAHAKFQSSALSLVDVFETEYIPGGFMPYLPDSLITYLTYALVCLLKSTQPQFSDVCSNAEPIFGLVERMATQMEAHAVAPDHIQYLHSLFLRRLLHNRARARDPLTRLRFLDAGESARSRPPADGGGPATEPLPSGVSLLALDLGLGAGAFAGPGHDGSSEYFATEGFWNSIFPHPHDLPEADMGWLDMGYSEGL